MQWRRRWRRLGTHPSRAHVPPEASRPAGLPLLRHGGCRRLLGPACRLHQDQTYRRGRERGKKGGETHLPTVLCHSEALKRRRSCLCRLGHHRNITKKGVTWSSKRLILACRLLLATECPVTFPVSLKMFMTERDEEVETNGGLLIVKK